MRHTPAARTHAQCGGSSGARGARNAHGGSHGASSAALARAEHEEHERAPLLRREHAAEHQPREEGREEDLRLLHDRKGAGVDPAEGDEAERVHGEVEEGEFVEDLLPIFMDLENGPDVGTLSPTLSRQGCGSAGADVGSVGADDGSASADEGSASGDDSECMDSVKGKGKRKQKHCFLWACLSSPKVEAETFWYCSAHLSY